MLATIGQCAVNGISYSGIPDISTTLYLFILNLEELFIDIQKVKYSFSVFPIREQHFKFAVSNHKNLLVVSKSIQFLL